MSTKIEVDFAAVDATAAKIGPLIDQYKKNYENIYEIVEEIYEKSSWLGSEAREFNRNLNDFRDDFEDLLHKFEQYKSFLEKSKRAYDATQQSTHAFASKLSDGR